jgi:TolA-binding protein
MQTEQTLSFMSPYDEYTLAKALFDQRDYYGAARVLRRLVETYPDERDLAAARELLVRSYYHSAQISRAVEAARDLVQRQPDNAYAALLLARSLERSSEHEQAAAAQRLASALGVA